MENERHVTVLLATRSTRKDEFETPDGSNCFRRSIEWIGWTQYLVGTQWNGMDAFDVVFDLYTLHNSLWNPTWCSVDCAFVWTSKDVSYTFWQWFIFCDIFHETYLWFLFSHLNLENVTFTRHLYCVRLLDVSLHTFHRSLRHIQKFSAISLWSEWFLHMIYTHTHPWQQSWLVQLWSIHPSIAAIERSNGR